MDILVLLKQVPATESFITIADSGSTIKPDGLKYVINPYDELAVEEALKIREAQGGSVTILSVGPAKAAEAIRTGLAMGADRGVLIDPQDSVCDALGTAKLLAAAIKNESCDLIIAGHRAVDDDNYQVGAAVAELLGIANISMVISTLTSADGKIIQCQCTVEGGTKTVKAALPALITTQRGSQRSALCQPAGYHEGQEETSWTPRALADLGVWMPTAS